MDVHNDEDIKMYFYENRLKTFEGWPFDEDCACNAENVSVDASSRIQFSSGDCTSLIMFGLHFNSTL